MFWLRKRGSEEVVTHLLALNFLPLFSQKKTKLQNCTVFEDFAPNVPSVIYVYSIRQFMDPFFSYMYKFTLSFSHSLTKIVVARPVTVDGIGACTFNSVRK